VVWVKFHKHRETLINKHVSLKLRLKYLNAMISPTILFGLSSLLNVVQRRMLWSIVGWVVVSEDDWGDTMKRMNDRLQSATSLHQISPWSVSLFRRQFQYLWHLVNNPEGWPLIQQNGIPAATGSTTFLSHHAEDVDAHTKDGTTICTNLFNPNFNNHHGLSLLEVTHVGSRLKSGMLTFVNFCIHCSLHLVAFEFVCVSRVLKGP